MDNLYSPSHPAEDAAQYRERVMGILREPSRAAGDEGAGDGRAVAPRSRSRQTNLALQLGLPGSQKDLGSIGGKLAGKVGENKYLARPRRPRRRASIRSRGRSKRGARARAQAGVTQDTRSKCQYKGCRHALVPGDVRLGKKAPNYQFGHSPKTKWYHVECMFESFKARPARAARPAPAAARVRETIVP